MKRKGGGGEGIHLSASGGKLGKKASLRGQEVGTGRGQASLKQPLVAEVSTSSMLSLWGPRGPPSARPSSRDRQGPDDQARARICTGPRRGVLVGAAGTGRAVHLLGGLPTQVVSLHPRGRRQSREPLHLAPDTGANGTAGALWQVVIAVTALPGPRAT